MPTRLKLRQVCQVPERFVALEYESDKYLSYAFVREIPNIVWESEPLETELVAQLLLARGWHQTDIGDEICEARQYARPAA